MTNVKPDNPEMCKTLTSVPKRHWGKRHSYFGYITVI